MTYFNVKPQDATTDQRGADERPILLVLAFNGNRARQAAEQHVDGLRRCRFITRPWDLRGCDSTNSELLVDLSFWESNHRIHWGLASVALLSEWGFMR